MRACERASVRVRLCDCVRQCCLLNPTHPWLLAPCTAGHYTTFCLDPNQGNWRLFDDVRVSTATEEDVRSSQAFLLVYTNSNSTSRVD